MSAAGIQAAIPPVETACRTPRPLPPAIPVTHPDRAGATPSWRSRSPGVVRNREHEGRSCPRRSAPHRSPSPPVSLGSGNVAELPRESRRNGCGMHQHRYNPNESRGRGKHFWSAVHCDLFGRTPSPRDVCSTTFCPCRISSPPRRLQVVFPFAGTHPRQFTRGGTTDA